MSKTITTTPTFMILLLGLSLTSALTSIIIPVVHAQGPVIEEITAIKEDSTVTLTITITYPVTYIVDTGKQQAMSGMWVYSSVNFISSIEIEVDGVAQRENTSRWTVSWEDERLLIITETFPRSSDNWQTNYVDHVMTDVIGNPTVRVRAAAYLFPANEYEWGAWTEPQTVQELLADETTESLGFDPMLLIGGIGGVAIVAMAITFTRRR